MDEEALHILLMLGFFRSSRKIVHTTAQGGLMPGQPKILEYLWYHDGASQKEIGTACVLDKSTVTSLLKRMEKAGYIRKEARADDQRSVSIYMTPAGQEKAAWVRSIVYHIDDEMWQGVTQEEQEQFIRTFHKIIENQKKWGL